MADFTHFNDQGRAKMVDVGEKPISQRVAVAAGRVLVDEHRSSVEIKATVSCDGRTGVEMEALTAVSTAALTVYDMCKAVQKDMTITDIRLLSKTGGIHGDYKREDKSWRIQQQ